MKTIFLHGLGQNALSWNETIKILDGSFDIDCPDLFQMKMSSVNYDNLYESFEKYLNTYNEPINICGLSLGGMLAMNYAINNPDKVNSLVLIGVQYVMPKKLMQLQNFIFKFIPSKFFSKIGMSKKNVISLAKSMTDLSFEKDLNKITCPVMIICGEKDKANLSASVNLSKILSNVRYEIITKSGHEVNKDNPKKLAEILKEFFFNL